jgi:hypothetical protein
MCFSLALTAEQINLPIGEQTRAYDLQLPDRSITKEMVRQTFDMPVAIDAVVKHPQIKQTK